MRKFGKVAMSALMLAGASMLTATPASAQVDFGISFGFGPGFVPYSDPCAYYDYYDEPPPWGLPPDYCDYPVYFDPVFWGGEWYRGPIYYRWYGGERLYWLDGGWRHDEWRGARPQIRWEDRGGWGHGRDWGRGGYDRNRSYYSGGGHNWSGGNGGHNNWSGNGGNWSGNSGGGNGHIYSGGNSGGGHNNWSGGGHNWSGGGHIYSGGNGGGGHNNWSGGGGGGHGWSGGGGGGHGWSGGGGHGEGGHGGHR